MKKQKDQNIMNFFKKVAQKEAIETTNIQNITTEVNGTKEQSPIKKEKPAIDDNQQLNSKNIEIFIMPIVKF